MREHRVSASGLAVHADMKKDFAVATARLKPMPFHNPMGRLVNSSLRHASVRHASLCC
jgi:hypothetical protein